jgi:hypothetical protein
LGASAILVAIAYRDLSPVVDFDRYDIRNETILLERFESGGIESDLE